MSFWVDWNSIESVGKAATIYFWVGWLFFALVLVFEAVAHSYESRKSSLIEIRDIRAAEEAKTRDQQHEIEVKQLVLETQQAKERTAHAILDLRRGLAWRRYPNDEKAYAPLNNMLTSFSERELKVGQKPKIDIILFGMGAESTNFVSWIHQCFRDNNWDCTVWQVRGCNFVPQDIEIAYRTDRPEWKVGATSLKDVLAKSFKCGFANPAYSDVAYTLNEGKFPKGISELKNLESIPWDPVKAAPIRMFVGEKSDMQLTTQ